MFLSLVLIPLTVFSLFEDNPVVREEPVSVIRQATEDPDYCVVSIIYDSQGHTSRQFARTLLDLAPKLSNYIKFFAFDCRSDPSVCPEEYLPQLPSVTAYVPEGIDPSTGKPLVNERAYTGSISGKDIGEFFANCIPYLGDFLDSKNLPQFLKEEGNKTILFTNKDSVPVIYRGVTSKYRGRLEFGIIWSNSTEIIEKYEVHEYPTLIVLQDDHIERYSGKLDFSKISDFINKFASRIKKAPKQFKKINSSGSKIELPEFEILQLDSTNFQERIKETPGTVLVHFHKDKPLQEWDTIINLYNGIVSLASISCKSNQDFCSSLGVKKYPSLRLFPALKTRKSFEISYEPIPAFEEEILKEIKFDVQTIHESSLSSFLQSLQSQQKAVCLYIGPGQIPIQFKALAAAQEFKDFARFVSIVIPQDRVNSYFSIQQYPVVISLSKVNADDKLTMLDYTGELTDYRSLYYFVDNVSIPTFLEKQPKILEEDQDDIDHVQDNASLHTKCLKRGGLCVIGFMDSHEIKHSEEYKILKYVKAAMDLRKLPLHFVWIDGLCQHELLETFGISEVPGIGVYSQTKKKASRLEGKFNSQDIFGFIEQALRSKAETFEISELNAIDRVCKESRKEEENETAEQASEDVGDSSGSAKKKKRKSNWKAPSNDL